MVAFILALVIGTALGYAHTWIAVKMIFRPLRAYHIWGLQIPLTPGLFVKRRTVFTTAIAEMIEERFASGQELKDVLAKAQDSGVLEKMIKDAGPLATIAWGVYCSTSTGTSVVRDCDRIASGLKSQHIVAKMVADKLNQMPMEEIEALVMKVSHRELSAIVWFGAALGAIIALTQVVMQ